MPTSAVCTRVVATIAPPSAPSLRDRSAAPNLHREIPSRRRNMGLSSSMGRSGDGHSQGNGGSRRFPACADARSLLCPARRTLSLRRLWKKWRPSKGRVSGAILFSMVKTGTVFNVSGQGQIKDLGYPVLETDALASASPIKKRFPRHERR